MALSILFVFCFCLPVTAFDLDAIINDTPKILKTDIEGQHLFIQLRPVLEANGYKLVWNSTRNEIIAVKDYQFLVLSPGANYVLKNSHPFSISSPVKVVSGSTMVPLDFLRVISQGALWEDKKLLIKDSIHTNSFKDIEEEMMSYMEREARIEIPHIRSNENRITVSRNVNLSRNTVKDFDLRKPSSITAHELDIYFQGTPLEGTGKYFIEAELMYDVNAVFLAALAKHESASGTSRIAKDKNNLFGWGASAPDPYNNAITFDNKAECINVVSQSVAKNYLTPGGRFHKGSNLTAMNRFYARDGSWALKVANTMLDINNQTIKHF